MPVGFVLKSLSWHPPRPPNGGELALAIATEKISMAAQGASCCQLAFNMRCAAPPKSVVHVRTLKYIYIYVYESHWRTHTMSQYMHKYRKTSIDYGRITCIKKYHNVLKCINWPKPGPLGLSDPQFRLHQGILGVTPAECQWSMGQFEVARANSQNWQNA